MEASDATLSKATPSDEVKRIYADYVAEIHKREVSSWENFDKSVLTFSSAGLALSVGFLKDFVPIQSAAAPASLYASWILFTAATCFTITSFIFSAHALGRQKDVAYDFYIEGNGSAFNKRNVWNTVTRSLNYASAGSFLVALVLTTTFIAVNLERGSKVKDTMAIPAQPELMQKGLPVPTMQPVPSNTFVPSAPAPAPSAPVSSGSK